MSDSPQQAFGAPGISPRWTSSAKDGVGTAINAGSPVWFTHSHGILNEVYYPRVDRACMRDCGLIVTDGREFFSEEKRDADTQVEQDDPGAPYYRLVNTCLQGRYRITKEIVTDPLRDALLQRVRFEPLEGELGDYHLYVLLSPHMDNRGSENTAWLGDYKGVPVLYAMRGEHVLALACSAGWRRRSVGFVGFSDGWRDLKQNKQLTWLFERAEGGNVALTGEIDLQAAHGECVLAVGFGPSAVKAAQEASAALVGGFEGSKQDYLDEWRRWQQTLPPLEQGEPEPRLYRTSAMVLRAHESKDNPGGIIASLSIPWGASKGDEDLSGYHLCWPRDLGEAAGGLLACGALDDARRTLQYFQVTQEPDGHWLQNMWLDGSPYWTAIQLDETAMPILVVDLAHRHGAVGEGDLRRLWPMVRRAAGFLARSGPVSPQDRWENEGGYSPFTLAVAIAALLFAADQAERQGEPEVARYLRETADSWNASIERWIYATETSLAAELGVEGYYVRISEPERDESAEKRSEAAKHRPESHVISPDALALVRFGLRGADDPRIENTVRVIDHLLRVEFPAGPGWHRYPDDHYGEHADGAPFTGDGRGIGRAWPLLTGERGHFELARGRRDEAERLLHTIESFSRSGMLPEQVWDTDDIPERELFFGHPAGSAMPLAWAHAEYLKLARSLRDGAVFDTPPQTVERYLKRQQGSPHAIWRFNHKLLTMPVGKTLRIETRVPARIHWGLENWRRQQDTPTVDTGLGIHYADLPTAELPGDTAINFTFYWPEAGHWEGRDFYVHTEMAPSAVEAMEMA